MELLANPQKLAAYREQAAALTAQMTLEETRSWAFPLLRKSGNPC